MNTGRRFNKADCSDLSIHIVPACLTADDNKLRLISVLQSLKALCQEINFSTVKGGLLRFF